MKKASLTVFAVLSVLLVFALSASIQTFGQEGEPSVSAILTTDATHFRGANIVGQAGYFEVADVVHINISDYVNRPNQWSLINFSTKYSTPRDVTVFFPNITLDDLQRKAGYELINTTSLSYTYNQTLLPNGSIDGTVLGVDSINTTFNVTKWNNINLNAFDYNGFDVQGKTIQNLGSNLNGEYRIRGYCTSGERNCEYSIIFNATVAGKQVYVDFDPMINSSTDEVARYVFNNSLADYSMYYGTPLTSDNELFASDTIGTSSIPYVMHTESTNSSSPRTANPQITGGTEGVTVATWYYIESYSTPDYMLGNGATTGWQAGNWEDSSNGVGMLVDGAMKYNTGGRILGVGKWHHLFYEWNSTHTTFWYDNILNGTAASGGLPTPTATVYWNSYIDTNFYGDTRWYCTRFFNGTLTQAQRDLIYNGSNGDCTSLYDLENPPGSDAATESEGDNAIQTAINSSVPSATKYKTQQVYVVNSSDTQWQGTVDYLVVQTSPQRRWLLNYITTGESYLNAANLSSAVYVLELTDLSIDDITQQVSTLINATK